MKTQSTTRIVRNNHLGIITSARNAGKIVTEFVGGVFQIQTPGKSVATVYHPTGEVRRVKIA